MITQEAQAVVEEPSAETVEDIDEKVKRYPEDFLLSKRPSRLFGKPVNEHPSDLPFHASHYSLCRYQGFNWSQGVVSPFQATKDTVITTVLDHMWVSIDGTPTEEMRKPIAHNVSCHGLWFFRCLGPDDLVLDLGCGDGRFLVAAAQRYRCKGGLLRSRTPHRSNVT